MSNTMSQYFKKFVGITFVASSFAMVGCSGKPSSQTSSSQIKTVNLPHSEVKKQTIGNCWIYAVVGWIESLVLKDTEGKTTLNLSETYLSYRHFEEQLLDMYEAQPIETGGSFYEATRLIKKYGVMEEGTFIPGEANTSASRVQATALALVNASLESGKLADMFSLPTRAERLRVIRAELDRAFGVNMASLQSKILPAERVIVRHDNSGKAVSLSAELDRWREIDFPSSYGSRPQDISSPRPTKGLTKAQQDVLKKVKRALNDGNPVMLSWFVDFNGMANGTFSLRNLQAAGKPGRQGGHLTVLEDYVSSGINPETGKSFVVAEGEVSPAEKDLALNYGNIDYFVTKNSWGTAETTTYLRDGSYGYHRLMSDYLFGWIPVQGEKTSEISTMTQGINGFVLPLGY